MFDSPKSGAALIAIILGICFIAAVAIIVLLKQLTTLTI